MGTRFKTIMEAAAEKLDGLVIVNAAGLSYHNFKKLLPHDVAHDGAKHLAGLRESNWMSMNQKYIDETMGDRCEVVPMDVLTDNPTFQDRSDLIRAIYDQGDNPVTEWFDYSMKLDIETRGPRLERKGIFLGEDSIRDSGLAYLCDEYAMRSLMRERWGLDEIYLGLAVRDDELFQQLNDARPDIDLTIPPNHEIVLTEITPIHDKKLGRSAMPIAKMAQTVCVLA